MGTLRIEIPKEEIEAFCRKWRVKEFSIFVIGDVAVCVGLCYRDHAMPRHARLDAPGTLHHVMRDALHFFNLSPASGLQPRHYHRFPRPHRDPHR
jgi:hypothetical protein